MPDSRKIPDVKPTIDLTAIDADTEGVYCRNCAQPAIYFDPGRGNYLCLHCAITPVPPYGPGYRWQGEGPHNRSLCNERSPRGGWYCNVALGHDRLHEAHGGYETPIMAWTPDGEIVFTRDRRWRVTEHPPWQGHAFTEEERAAGYCGSRRTRIDPIGLGSMTCVCTIPRGHDGWHEAWRPHPSRRTEPVLAWSQDQESTWTSDTTR